MITSEHILDLMKEVSVQDLENLFPDEPIGDIETAWQAATDTIQHYCISLFNGAKSGFSSLVVKRGDGVLEQPDNCDDPWFALVQWNNGSVTPLPIVLGSDTFPEQYRIVRELTANSSEMQQAQSACMDFVRLSMPIAPDVADYEAMYDTLMEAVKEDYSHAPLCVEQRD